MTDPSQPIEKLLERAFAPIDPPQHLYGRLEVRLGRVTFAAAEELADWELMAMRDPRNWVAPATAAVVGAGAGTALLVMHLRRRHRSGGGESLDALEALSSAFGDAALELATGGMRRRPGPDSE